MITAEEGYGAIYKLMGAIEHFEQLKKSDEQWGFLHRQRQAAIEARTYFYFTIRAAIKILTTSADISRETDALAVLKEAIAEVCEGDGEQFKKDWWSPDQAPEAEYTRFNPGSHLYNASDKVVSNWSAKTSEMAARGK